MKNIRIDLAYTIVNGSEVVFTAPCSCNKIGGIKVYYPDGSKEFTFKDAHGNDLTGIGELFAEGAFVKAILDVTNGFAYIQNADTNAYLEQKFKDLVYAETKAYLPPTKDDIDDVLGHILFPDMHPIPEGANYDLNGDGVVNDSDVSLAIAVNLGKETMENCAGAVKRPVTIRINVNDPKKTIHIFGTNQWGSLVETYIGIDKFNSSFITKESLEKIIAQDDDGATYRYVQVGDELVKEYFNPPMMPGYEYRTTERHRGKPVYVTLVTADDIPMEENGTKSLQTVIPMDAEIIYSSGTLIDDSVSAVMPFPAYDSQGLIAWFNINKLRTVTFPDKYAHYDVFISTARSSEATIAKARFIIKYTKD